MNTTSTPLRAALAAWSCAALASAAQDVRAPWIAYPTSFYPAGLSPQDGVLADLDGDGHLDVAVVTAGVNPRLSVLLGDGIGGFEPAIQQTPSVGGKELAAADLDGDGDVDLVSGDSFASSFSFHPNLGDGSFGESTQWPLGGVPDGIDVADVDGDGVLDVLAALPQALALAVGNGDGTFQPPGLFIVATGARDVVAGDLDGDGDTDAVVGHSSDQISVLENIGIGFGFPETYASIATGSFDSDANLILADVDGDGDLDVSFSSTSTGDALGGPGFGAIALYRNDGTGSFGAVETVELIPGGPGAVDLFAADITDDGAADLLAATGDGSWILLAADGSGDFLAPEQHRTGGGPSTVFAGDLDGDGDLEVLSVSSGAAEVCVHSNLGAGQFFQPEFHAMVDAAIAPASSSELASEDIDGDGDADLVVGYSGNFIGVYGISVSRNDGTGGFGPPETYSTPEFPEWLTTGDVDDDGDTDIVWLDGWNAFSPKLRLKRNLGDGTFGTTEVLPGSYCEQDVALVLEDMNSDGLPEILVYTCQGSVSLLLNTGGSFGNPISTFITFGGSGALAAADFDGDGFGDIATNDGIQGYVNVRLGLGNGQFGPPQTFVTGRGVSALDTADLNGDGDPDIVAAFLLDGDGVSVLLGESGAGFAPALTYPGTYSGYTDDIEAADLDGDGLVDVLVADHDAQQISVWRGAGDGSLEDHVRYGAELPTETALVRDMDGDGTGDLVALVLPSAQNGWWYPAVTVLDGLQSPWSDLGLGLAGSVGTPTLSGAGAASPGANFALSLDGAAALAPTFLVVGTTRIDLPILGGTLVPSPDFLFTTATDAEGGDELLFPWPPNGAPGLELTFQSWVIDAAAAQGVAASNGLLGTQP